MKLRENDKPQWFFMWVKGHPYICSICTWTRKDLIIEVEKMMGADWKRIYRQGGRAVKCDIVLKEQP